MARGDRETRLFRLLLRLYPRAYRARYGEEMEAFFRRERASRGRGGGFWFRLLADHVMAAWAVRFRRRSVDGMPRASGAADDLRAAVRGLRRAPAFTTLAVITVALGVGATTAVFTVVDRVALRPLPYPDSERMALVGIDPRSDPGALGPLSPALLDGLSSRPGPAEAVVAARTREEILEGPRGPERVDVTEVSEGFLALFGARPALGRLLDAADHRASAPPVVVLGARTWGERFGGDPGAVGRSLTLDGVAHVVIGVLDPGFHAPPELVENDALWVPLDVDLQEKGSFFLAGVARMRPGTDLTAMERHGEAVVGEIYESGESAFVTGLTVRSYQESVVGHVGGDLGRVFGAVLLLLLVSCVNVAGLLLTRGAERRHELGLHFALGAPRLRLVRLLLWESGLLAGVGALLGVVLASGAVTLFRAYSTIGLPRLAEVSLDARGAAFAVGAAALTALAAGLLPALRSTRALSRGADPLRGATAGRREGRVRGGLIAAETGLAVVLAVASGLLALDLIRVASEDAGFRPEGLVAMTLNLEPRHGRDAWADTWGRLAEGARRVPGVTAATVATQAPWDGTRMASTYRPEGWTEEEGAFAATVAVDADYLPAVGARLVEGRPLTASAGDVGDILVNEAFVARHWPGESGVGREVRSGDFGENSRVHRVVGVVADVATKPGQDVFPHVFHPLTEAPWREMEVLVRTSGDPSALVPLLRELVRELDPGLPVTEIRTMDVVAAAALAPPRFYASLFGGFALAALILAVAGVYGTTAYATRARLREAGIRRVLGARGAQVVGNLVLRSGVAVGIGVAVGLIAAALASTALAGMLARVDPRDWGPYAVVGIVVSLTGVVAAWVPAGAAGRADPVNTLREEAP